MGGLTHFWDVDSLEDGAFMSADAVSSSKPRPRIASIDVLRGFALLGIFLMNAQTLAMPMAAYFNPLAYGGRDAFNRSLHGLVHIVADQKFMALFSLLFGASMLLIIEGRQQKGLSVAKFHYFRNFWLLLIGLAHGLLIWSGDILSIYACCAFVLYWFKNLGPRLNCFLGLICFFSPTLLYLNLDATNFASVKDFSDFWQGTGTSLASAIKYRQTSWSTQVAGRLGDFGDIGQPYPDEVIGILLFDIPFRAFGMMLLGMGLYRYGWLSAGKEPRFYRRCTLWGLGVGVLLSGAGLWLNEQHDWGPGWALGPGRIANLWAAPAMAVGYIGLVMRWCQSTKAEALRDGLARVGQMALSNYIAQSVLGSLAFFGFGFGLFGQVNRAELLVFILLVWVLLLVTSKLWLQRFCYGPCEWLWRSLTYLRIQPLWRRAPK